MIAGNLRYRLTIQKDVGTTRDAAGQPVADWRDEAVVWASIEPISGREIWLAAQAQADVTHRVKIRHRTGITADKRLKFGTRTLQIISVLNSDERKRELQLLCREKP